jgi:hypothetical protein
VSKNAYEINEQVQGVHDEVPAAHVMFLNNQLRVINDEAADNE